MGVALAAFSCILALLFRDVSLGLAGRFCFPWGFGNGGKGEAVVLGGAASKKERILITFRGCIGIRGLELFIALHSLWVISVLRGMEFWGVVSWPRGRDGRAGQMRNLFCQRQGC